MGLSIQATIKQAMRFAKADKKRVRFVSKVMTGEAQGNGATITAIYGLGADNNYLGKANRAKAHILILRKSTQKVNVANGGMSTETNVTPLPILQLSKAAAEAHTFEDYPPSLLSVGSVNDDGNV